MAPYTGSKSSTYYHENPCCPASCGATTLTTSSVQHHPMPHELVMLFLFPLHITFSNQNSVFVHLLCLAAAGEREEEHTQAKQCGPSCSHIYSDFPKGIKRSDIFKRRIAFLRPETSGLPGVALMLGTGPTG